MYTDGKGAWFHNDGTGSACDIPDRGEAHVFIANPRDIARERPRQGTAMGLIRVGKILEARHMLGGVLTLMLVLLSANPAMADGAGGDPGSGNASAGNRSSQLGPGNGPNRQSRGYQGNPAGSDGLPAMEIDSGGDDASDGSVQLDSGMGPNMQAPGDQGNPDDAAGGSDGSQATENDSGDDNANNGPVQINPGMGPNMQPGYQENPEGAPAGSDGSPATENDSDGDD